MGTEAPSEEQPDSAVGRTLGGKYRLIRALGSGGMGHVYEAENERTGGRFAVKLLHPEFARSSDVAKRFEQEARTATRIGHPSIVRVIDLDWESSDGSLYMVQELLTGSDLRARLLREPRLPPRDALAIILPIVDALAAAHDAGVLHRDIKPANIFLAEEPGGRVVPKLIDFGIAKVLVDKGGGGDVTRTHAGFSLIGTLIYMSPEQLQDLPDVDGRADEWAIATVLYQMLAGRCPFPGPTGNPPSLVGLARFVERVNSEPVLRIDELVTGLPPALVGVLHRALQTQRERRFATLRELHRALLACEPAVADLTAAAEPAAGAGRDGSTIALGEGDLLAPSRVDPATRVGAATAEQAAPRRVGARLVVAGVLALLVAAGVVWISRREPPAASPITPAPVAAPAAPIPPAPAAPAPVIRATAPAEARPSPDSHPVKEPVAEAAPPRPAPPRRHAPSAKATKEPTAESPAGEAPTSANGAPILR